MDDLHMHPNVCKPQHYCKIEAALHALITKYNMNQFSFATFVLNGHLNTKMLCGNKVVEDSALRGSNKIAWP